MLGKSKRQRPKKQRRDVMHAHEDFRQRHGFRREVIHAEDQRLGQQDHNDQRRHGNIGDFHQLFRVIFYLLHIPGTHALPNDGDHGKPHGISRNTAYVVHIVCHGVGCDLCGFQKAEMMDSTMIFPQIEKQLSMPLGTPMPKIRPIIFRSKRRQSFRPVCTGSSGLRMRIIMMTAATARETKDGMATPSPPSGAGQR